MAYECTSNMVLKRIEHVHPSGSDLSFIFVGFDACLPPLRFKYMQYIYATSCESKQESPIENLLSLLRAFAKY